MNSTFFIKMHNGINLMEVDPNGSCYKYGAALAHILSTTNILKRLICESKRRNLI